MAACRALLLRSECQGCNDRGNAAGQRSYSSYYRHGSTPPGYNFAVHSSLEALDDGFLTRSGGARRPPDLGCASRLDQEDPEVGGRRFELGADDCQIPFVDGAHRAYQAGSIAAPALCLVESLVNEADGILQRNLGYRTGHREERVSDRNRALDGLSAPQHGIPAHRLQQP